MFLDCSGDDEGLELNIGFDTKLCSYSQVLKSRIACVGRGTRKSVFQDMCVCVFEQVKGLIGNKKILWKLLTRNLNK